MTNTNKTEQEPRSGLSDLTVGLGVDQELEIKRFEGLGYKTLPEEHKSFQCRKCWEPGGLVFKDYDDEGCHEDVEYRCVICGKGWIAEGSDY